MKKMIAALTAAVMTVGLAGCGETKELTVKSQSSQLYTEEDIDSSVDHILDVVEMLDGVADDVSYLGDEYSSDRAVLDKLNKLSERELHEQEEYTECMGFTVDFHYSKSPKAVLRHMLNGEWVYVTLPAVHHQIWFARTEDGEWEEAYVDDGDVLEYTPPGN